MAACAQNEASSHRHLSDLLAPLSFRPEELAERLLARFGTIGMVAEAPESELRNCSLYGERWVESFLSIRQLVRDGQRERVLRSSFDGRSEDLHRYLLGRMGSLRSELILCFFCDASGFIIAKEIMAEGAEDSVSLPLRLVFSRALSLDARRIAFAHNHPSGSAEPSRDDIGRTAELICMADRLGIAVEDHLVVGRRHVVSMKARGLL